MAMSPFRRRRCLAALPRAVSLAAALLLLSACDTPSPRAVPGPAPDAGNGGPTSAREFAWSSRLASAEDQIAGSLRDSGASVARTKDDRLWIVLPGDLSFEPGRSALKPQVRSLLDRVVVALRGVPKAEVRIVGHTDSRGTVAGNNALSLDRAASTRDWMVARGMSPMRFAVAGRGALDPVAGNDDEAGRARNRRVEILVGERRQPAPGGAK
jgi:outer membrane protein OmpA-like peptidoglycan-associated protein